MRSRDLKLDQENGSSGRKASGENVDSEYLKRQRKGRGGGEWNMKRQTMQVKKKFYKKAKYF